MRWLLQLVSVTALLLLPSFISVEDLLKFLPAMFVVAH
ncbi:hypothetical protein ACZ87_02751 [Candidatus Erwinia dacicola]|uniref:Uncharacterized protein n=1 Tax=Candidatus Erwinia dacicola TaxID=252393 RepID=A0A328TNA1_9GAMM|nr:hypothetical protein ACZ87_02751 [Candidatus Erwinia dacicola]